MKGKLGVPESRKESLCAFVQDEGIAIEIVADIPEDPVATEHSASTVTVREAPEGERPKSDLQVLHSGGWMHCEAALAMAEKLGISSQHMGKLLDHLEVKVRDCNLGCF